MMYKDIIQFTVLIIHQQGVLCFVTAGARSGKLGTKLEAAMKFDLIY